MGAFWPICLLAMLKPARLTLSEGAMGTQDKCPGAGGAQLCCVVPGAKHREHGDFGQVSVLNQVALKMWDRSTS